MPALSTPTVPDDAIALVSAEVQATWAADESTIAALGADIEAAQSMLASAEAISADARTSSDEADSALTSARTSSLDTRTSGRSPQYYDIERRR